jgi:tRNA pseudouridine38-40 synthase
MGTVLRLPAPRVVVAGRTDAGVHAQGQVGHVDLPADVLGAMRARDGAFGAAVLSRRLTGILPADIVVHRVRVAPDGFDARFSALRRTYVYRVADTVEHRDPLARAQVLWHRRALDHGAMAVAAEGLLGLHDFAAFCRAREGATTIRTLEVFDWLRPDAGPDAGLVVARVVADAFCHSMVRALVGACLAVGEGRRPASWPAALLGTHRRESTVAPAHGLTLARVTYPDDSEMAARAALTRARRTTDGTCPGLDGD